MDTNFTPNHSKKLIIVAGGAALALVIVVIATLMALGGSSDEAAQNNGATTTDESQALSVEPAREGSAIVDGSMEQLNESLKDAENAVKDESDHQKVSE